MNTSIARTIVAICFLTISTPVFAEVTLPAVFASGMVLQRQLPVPVWGTAGIGERISVTFAGQEVHTTADKVGNWLVKLEPLKTSKQNRSLVVKGSNTITLDRVLVGEVWLCSGQSNMAGKFVAAKGRVLGPEAFKRDLSGLRFSTSRGWYTMAENNQNLISCVAYYFGNELYKELDIPIGLVLRYNSGTPIQAWMPLEASETIRKRLNIPADWNDAADNRNPAVQFNDKIAPIVPFAFRGTIWYQGERNAKAQTGWEYDKLLSFHIKTWRELWATRAKTEPRDFPFYYVQVPTQDSTGDGEWPWLRDAMRRALGITPRSGMAVFYDFGPSLHPPNKEPAGKRLSLWALAKDYGRTDLVHCGPLLDKVTIDGSVAVLSFTHVGSGLKSKSGDKTLKFFEIAAKDGKYVAANARIVDNTVIVQSDKIALPVYVRYLFRKPEPNAGVSLINGEGLPASSFITDDFKPERNLLIRPRKRRSPK